MIWIGLIMAYLIGAIPFGVIIARLRGIDLRTLGSGNIGATNVGRALGRRWGIFCFFLDACKGLVPMVFMLQVAYPSYLAQGGQEATFLWLWLLAGGLAILGHVFPIYLKFRGGKGVSTSFGVALGLWPYFTTPALVSLVIWLVVLKRSRYVSLSSIIAASAFPGVLLAFIGVKTNWALETLWPLFIVALIIPLLVLYLHRSNIQRLCQGTENRIGRLSSS